MLRDNMYKRKDKYVNKLKAFVKTENIVYIMSIVTLAIMGIVNIHNLNYPVVLNDEFGYWGNAVSILGYDWKALIAETPYYAWGYSIWLIPIILIVPFQFWYKAAVGLNVFFLIIAYAVSVKTGEQLFYNVNKSIIRILCLITILYPSNMVYIQVTWSESLLYMLTWMATYLIVKLEKRFTYIGFFTAIGILSYMYMVHARTIGIIAVAIVCLFFIIIKHKKKIWHFIFPIFLLGLSYIINSKIKNYQIAQVWNNSSISAMNNVGLDKNTIAFFWGRLSNDLVFLLESLGAKLIVLFISTGFTFPIACIHIFKSAWKAFRTKKFLKQEFIISQIWCLGIIFSMWVICSLQMMYWEERKDVIVYSRYMENAMGPILLIGLIYVILKMKHNWIYATSAFIMMLLCIRNIYWRVLEAPGRFNTICSPIFGAFYEKFGDIDKTFYALLVLSVIFVVAILTAKKIKNTKWLAAIFGSVFISIFLIIRTNADRYLLDWRSNLDKQIVPVAKIISEDYEGKEIYYVQDKEHDLYSVNPKYLQFMIPKAKIEVIEKDKIDKKQIKGNSLLLLNPHTESIFNDIVPEIETNMLKAIYIE